jgi:hypothetical protein
MLIRLVVLGICLQLVACASAPPEPVVITPQVLDRQQKILESFYFGQPVQEALELVGSRGANIIEIKENDLVYQYVDAKFAETNMLFGLYFENRALKALILEQDVTDFFLCRAHLTNQGEHWLSQGIKPSAQWIAKRNKLGEYFDKRAHHQKSTGSSQVHAGDVVEALSYAPIIAVFLPIYVADQVAGGQQRAAKKKREKQYLYDAAPKVQLGYSEDQLISLLGSYNRKDKVGLATIFTYYEPSYSFGLIGGQVAWKESASMYMAFSPPANSSSTRGGIDCSSFKKDS